MARVDCLLLRMGFAETRTLGSLYQGDWFLGFTCEDRDRNLELCGIKIPKQTAIPRGYYRLTVSMSKRFGKIMPEILDVPQFSGVRIHGGNTEEDTEGCPLLGAIKTATGVRDCRDANAKLIKRIQAVEAAGDECWLTVR